MWTFLVKPLTRVLWIILSTVWNERRILLWTIVIHDLKFNSTIHMNHIGIIKTFSHFLNVSATDVLWKKWRYQGKYFWLNDLVEIIHTCSFGQVVIFLIFVRKMKRKKIWIVRLGYKINYSRLTHLSQLSASLPLPDHPC